MINQIHEFGKTGKSLSRIFQTARRQNFKTAVALAENGQQKFAEKERGQRYTDDNENGNRIVNDSVLVSSGSHSQRNCNNKLEYQRNGGDAEGYPHKLTDNVGDGTGVNKGISPVSGHKVPQPIDVTLCPRTVQSVRFIKGVNHFLSDLASSRNNILYLLAYEIVGHEPD